MSPRQRRFRRSTSADCDSTPVLDRRDHAVRRKGLKYGMHSAYYMRLMMFRQETRIGVGLALVCAIGLGLGTDTASAQSRFGADTASVQFDGQPYSLDMIIALALAK